MTSATTARGTKVRLEFVPDVEPNEGGYYVEVYHEDKEDRFDDFCVHPDDCDCDDDKTVERFAQQHVASITDY